MHCVVIVIGLAFKVVATLFMAYLLTVVFMWFSLSMFQFLKGVGKKFWNHEKQTDHTSAKSRSVP